MKLGYIDVNIIIPHQYLLS